MARRSRRTYSLKPADELKKPYIRDDTRICPECGKVFERYSPYWGWKTVQSLHSGETKTLFYCSYTCMRHGEVKAELAAAERKEAGVRKRKEIARKKKEHAADKEA